METDLSVRRSARLMIKELDIYIDYHEIHTWHNYDVFAYAIYHGDVNIVRTLLTVGRVDPYYNRFDGIRSKIKFGRTRLIMHACRYNRPKILDMLLQYEIALKPKCPFLYNDEFITACEKGHLNIVKVMLKDPRADPAMCENSPVKVACTNGHVHIVKLLVQYKRVTSLRWPKSLKKLLKDYLPNESNEDV